MEVKEAPDDTNPISWAQVQIEGAQRLVDSCSQSSDNPSVTNEDQAVQCLGVCNSRPEHLLLRARVEGPQEPALHALRLLSHTFGIRVQGHFNLTAVGSRRGLLIVCRKRRKTTSLLMTTTLMLLAP